jgi:hypothetical protein
MALSFTLLLLCGLQATIVVLFAICIFILTNLQRRSRSAHAKNPEVQAIREELQASELAALEKLIPRKGDTEAADTLSHLKDKLFRAIDYAIRRHDWYEDQRSKVLQATLAIASAFLAIAGFSVRLNSNISGPGTVIAVGMAITALLGLLRNILLFRSELNQDRPYRYISDIRFWFFGYNLPQERNKLFSSKAPLALAKSVAEDRKRFFSRVSDNFSLSRSLREDLEQLFILHVLQKYKATSLTKMQDVLFWLTIFLGIQVLLWFAVSLIA